MMMMICCPGCSCSQLLIYRLNNVKKKLHTWLQDLLSCSRVSLENRELLVPVGTVDPLDLSDHQV